MINVVVSWSLTFTFTNRETETTKSNSVVVVKARRYSYHGESDLAGEGQHVIGVNSPTLLVSRQFVDKAIRQFVSVDGFVRFPVNSALPV